MSARFFFPASGGLWDLGNRTGVMPRDVLASRVVFAGGAIFENAQVIAADYTVTSGANAHSVGPILINTGVTVTVSSGSNWLVL